MAGEQMLGKYRLAPWPAPRQDDQRGSHLKRGSQ